MITIIVLFAIALFCSFIVALLRRSQDNDNAKSAQSERDRITKKMRDLDRKPR